MNSPKILHLHVRYKYFDQVKAGTKTKEYRVVKRYWNKILSKQYDEIYYWKGYTKEKLIFKYNGYNTELITHEEFGKKLILVFAIKLEN